MSINRKHFYLSTCLPALAVSLCMLSFPAQAGFQWTPPEQKTAPAIMPEPVTRPTPEMHSPEPMPTEPVLQVEEVPHAETEMVAPGMKTKVFNEPSHDEAVPAQTTAHEEVPAEVVPEVAEIPVQPEPVAEATEEPGALSINPFPLDENNGQDQQTTLTPIAESKDTVLLPMDSDTPLSDLNDTDVLPPEPEPEQQEIIHWDQPESYEVVDGFGSDMPLALALSQVVPARYAFSFGEGVNPGIRVSWNGGKPWNEVLAEMLAPYNISTEIHQKSVHLKAASEAMPVLLDNQVEAAAVEEETAEAIPEPEDVAEETAALEEVKTEAFVEEVIVEHNADQGIAEVVSPKDLSRKTIKDPGSIATEQPSSVLMPEPEIEFEKVSMPIEEDIETELVDQAAVEMPPEPTETLSVATPTTESYDPAALTENKVWEAKQGSSLKDILYKWSKETGVNLIWNAERDYTLSSNVLISGTYESAVKVLFSKAVKGGPRYSFTSEGVPELTIGN